MDQNVSYELCTRIQLLEEQNQATKKEIKEKKEEIAIYKQNNLNLINDSLDSIELEMKKSIQKNEIIYHNIRENEENIKMNVFEFTIEYNSIEEIGDLDIIGDFTNYQLCRMNKRQGIYYYSTIFLKQFKYYYWMLNQKGDIIIDNESPHEYNLKAKQICNYVDFGSKGKAGMLFDYNLQRNILFLQKKNLHMINLNNWDEVSYLESLITFSKYFQQQYDILTTNFYSKSNLIANYFNEKILHFSKIESFTLFQLLSLFNECILINNTIQYEIIQVNEEQHCLICIQLYDSNHIQSNKEYYFQNSIFSKISFNKALEKDTWLLSSEESNKTKAAQLNNEREIMKVYYNKKEIEKVLPSQFYIPNRIEPSSLDINDYLFEVSDFQIITVKNKKDNLLIRFIAKEIEKVEKGKQIELYYSLDYKNVNIIHVHYLDTSLSQYPMEGIVVNNKHDLSTLKKNTTNKILLVCKSMKPFKLYSNGKTVHFCSHFFVHQRLYQIHSFLFESSFNHYYVKIKHIPLGHIIKKDPNDKIQGSQSTQFNYSIVEKCSTSNDIKGYIDVDLIFDQSKTILLESLSFSYPPCFLRSVDSNEEIELDNQYIENKKKNNSYEMQKYELIKRELKKYKIYNEKVDSLTQLSKETIKTMLFTLKDYESSTQIILKYIQEKEFWDKIEGIYNMQTEIKDYITKLTQYL